ncbi:MAG: hypothetical protein KDC79_08945 [Cyclobacteriaceae bacterium]|nr:hypothetical protein [Cyclobacteriaceae bacterium]
MIVAKDKLGVTTYFEDKKLIESTYKGRVDMSMSFDHLNKVAKFYETHEIRGAIIDLRELFGSFVKVMDYLLETFYPIAQKSGIKAQALVVTDDLIMKSLSGKLQNLASEFNITARVFNSREEAEEWMDSILTN